MPASTSFGVGPTYRTQITKHHIKTKEEETLTLVREMGEKIANATGTAVSQAANICKHTRIAPLRNPNSNINRKAFRVAQHPSWLQ